MLQEKRKLIFRNYSLCSLECHFGSILLNNWIVNKVGKKIAVSGM